MNSTELYNNYFAACLHYVYLYTGILPQTYDFVGLVSVNGTTVSIFSWNSSAPQPDNTTLQSYTVSAVQATQLQFTIQNGSINIQGQSYEPYQTCVSSQITQNIGILNNTEYYVTGNNILEIYAMSFMESSDNGGCTICLYDSARNVLIASDYITNTTSQWNELTILNQLSSSDNMVEIQAYCSSSTGVAYINSVSIAYY